MCPRVLFDRGSRFLGVNCAFPSRKTESQAKKCKHEHASKVRHEARSSEEYPIHDTTAMPGFEHLVQVIKTHTGAW